MQKVTILNKIDKILPNTINITILNTNNRNSNKTIY